MKRILASFALFFPVFLLAQAPARFVHERITDARAEGKDFPSVRLFVPERSSIESDALWSAAVRHADVLRFDASAGSSLLNAPVERISLELPSSTGLVVLDLIQADLFADGFQVTESATGARADVGLGIHYRGVLRGDSNSLAAISIFPDHVMGIISDSQGSRVLGPVEGDPQRRHVLYRDADLFGDPGFSCGVSDRVKAYSKEELRPQGGRKSIKCLNIYWEADYDLFQNKGSVANVTSYLTGLFNQMAILFDNDGVDMQLSEIFVWTEASPYTGTNSAQQLNNFGTYRTSFNGNLAHLLELSNYGGRAYLNTICSSTSVRMAYSGINSSYNNVPTYSWSTMVVTHETGHNLGSSHTHACVWNGNGTAIDGCGPTAGYTEGSCPNAGLPVGGGTIMSYCHLIGGTGINLALGFGPQPAALIVNRVNSASCLAACGTSCDPPLPLTVTNLTAVSATLGWANFGLGNYTLRWKPTSSGTWTTVTGLTGTTYSLTGLTQNTAYEFQVLSVCSGSNSAYSASTLFTTPIPCVDNYEPNNSTGAATVITLPASRNGLISPTGDNDYFRFTLSATGTINMGLSNLPADYDLNLRNSAGTIVASASAGGTTSESISYANAAPGDYYAQVFGWNGANNASVCYLLTVSYQAPSCSAPQGLSSNSITYNSAQITWTAGLTAITYDLRWKPSASSTWTNVNGLTTNSYALTGLDPLTSYDVQVRSVCDGPGGTQGNTSTYTQTHSFTTLEAPCEVVPRSVVAGKVFLEGPYKIADGLMLDSLRKLNLIPLTEPYSAMGHTITGAVSCSPARLLVTGNDAIVDWVLMELRENSSPYTVLEARVGLLERDGDVVAPDGTSPLGFCPPAGTYRVAVRHRNHLGAMTGSGIALSGTATAVDFTVSGTSTYGTNARKSTGGVMALWAGNVWTDATLRYTGQDNDRDPILTAIGGSVPTATINGYHLSDVNLDGTVKYTGQDNDRDPILTNIGGSVPTNSLQEQLP